MAEARNKRGPVKLQWQQRQKIAQLTVGPSEVVPQSKAPIAIMGSFRLHAC